MFGTREDMDRKAHEKICFYREVASYYPVIRKIAQKFDGKVYNCRFEKALQEALDEHLQTHGDTREHSQPRIYCSKRYKWVEIEIYIGGLNCCVASMKIEDLTDGKRIPAEIIIESARTKRESFLKSASNLERDISMIDEYKKQFNYLTGIINHLNGLLTWETRDIYNMNYYVNTR